MIRLPRTMTAPSCKGVLCSKILINSWLVTKPSTSIPVLSYSARDSFCSITINAPVFTLLISTQARVISPMVFSVKVLSLLLPLSKGSALAIRFLLPSSSSALRSSGCNTTIMAVTAKPNTFCPSHNMVFILKYEATTQKNRITSRPLSKVQALVFWIHSMIW